MFGDTGRGLFNWLRAWWESDRIRASPRDGRLLRIQVGDLLKVEHLEFEVVSRSLDSTGHRQLLRLSCLGSSGPASLEVVVDENITRQTATWNHSGIECDIDQNEVQVWPRCVAPAIAEIWHENGIDQQIHTFSTVKDAYTR